MIHYDDAMVHYDIANHIANRVCGHESFFMIWGRQPHSLCGHLGEI